MDETFSSLDEINKIELSKENLSILQAFESMDNWPRAPAKADISPFSDPAIVAPSTHFTSVNDEDMFMIFISEAEEDLTNMLQILKHLDQDDHINPALLVHLQRLGHKLRGTAGVVDFPILSTIASHIEIIAEQVSKQTVYPLIGIYALSKTITALEHHLHEITISQGNEPENGIILTTLDITYRNLDIDLQCESEKVPRHNHLLSDPEIHADITHLYENANNTENQISAPIATPLLLESMLEAKPYIYGNTCTDTKRFEKLTQRLEQLVELRTILENAQEESEKALQELQTAQMRLEHLSSMLYIFMANNSFHQDFGESISSSLIARILNEAIQRRSPLSFRKSRLQLRSTTVGTETTWDELDMERYSEKDLLLRSLKEAIADISLTTTRLQAAQAHLAMVQQEYVSRVALVRNAILQMRQAPLSVLVPRLWRVIKLSTLGQTQDVQFDVRGEITEIDLDTLEALALPLVRLLHTCITDTTISMDAVEQKNKKPPRIWLYIREVGNEIVIEIGFSITIHGGAIDAIRDSLQRLNGKMSLQRNENGGVSFFLHIPRLREAVRCLLVRTNHQKLVIPFSQILRIVDRPIEMLDRIYHLRDLLGFPAPVAAILVEHTQPILVMQQTEFGCVGIAVDEVVGEIELFVKPLKSYLQRPGIIGTAIDGKGSVTLMVDLPSLIRHSIYSVCLESTWQIKQDAEKPNLRTKQIRVLVADDAVYLRHSVRQTLQYANYIVIEARDGMEAIEKLQESVPEVCMLDVEMPNLNGYDVLSMLRQTPKFKHMKVIMLTSRSSEKHKLHAIELGAHAYLTKPCSQETLLTTIQELSTSF